MRIFLLGALLSLSLPAQPDPSARARQQAIELTKRDIANECSRAANGDWNAWHAALAPYRKELGKTYEASAKNPLVSRLDPKVTMPLIAWRSDPLHYVHANSVLTVSNAGDDLRAYLAGDKLTSIAAALTKWLKSKGIDLIFVPVPTKPEVYPEELVSDPLIVPKDLNVLPHLRRKMLGMLDAGVEVVDLYPGFMKMRRDQQECLFMVADKHWRDFPQKFAAQRIAARLDRYAWVKSARKRPALFKEEAAPAGDVIGFHDFIPESVAAKLMGFQRQGTNNVRTNPSGPDVVSGNSPILITGDSFVNHGYPFSAGLVGHLARFTNQPVSVLQVAGNVTQTFQDMFRDPEILQGKKVVIWVMNDEPFGCNFMHPQQFTVPR